jgi:DegV family protein with EDD domain
MSRVIVVTDSSASIPPDLAEELGIQIVPILLTVDGQTFRDGQEISSEQVYQWLRSSKRLPTTSAPSVGDFLRVYAAVSEEASGIVSIHISPKLSAIYNSAFTASQLIEEVPIQLINCRTAAMGQGFVVLEAARAAAAGADLESVVARATEVASKVSLLATLGTLEYLHRGGRIGGAATLLGTVLQIRPVLYVADGHVDVFARPRTNAKALRVMLDYLAERAAGRPIHVAILHADEPEEAEALRARIEESFVCTELYITPLTAVMGAHTGPGVLGIAFWVE